MTTEEAGSHASARHQRVVEPRVGADRVAVFTQRYLPYSQTFIYDEIRHHRRYAVEVFTGETMNLDRFPVANIHGDDARETRAQRLDGVLRSTVFYSAMHDRILRRREFGVLHAHFGTAAPHALPFRLRYGLPLIVTFHGFDAGVLERRLRWGRWRYRALAPVLFRYVTRFLAASEELASILVEAGAPAERVRVWRVGIEVPETTVAPRPRPNVLMVGRFVEKKGFGFGLEAFARVASRHPNARLDVVGEGPLAAELERAAAELGIADRVTFHGPLPHARVLELMGRSLVLLAPSVTTRRGDRESGLVVVKEAAARSVPAVASEHGGIPEIVRDGETGFLVPERDIGALAERLERFLDDASVRQAMGAAARADMERRYDIRDRVAELEDHYDEVRREAAAW